MNSLNKKLWVITFILDALFLIFLIVLLCLGHYFAALLSFSGILFASFLPFFFDFREDLVKEGHLSIAKTVVIRYLFLVLACVFPAILYLAIPSIREEGKNLPFLFMGALEAFIIYISVRFLVVFEDMKDNKDGENKE